MTTAWSGVRWALLAAVLVAAVTVQAKHVTPPESILHMVDDLVRDVQALEETPVRFKLNPDCLKANGKKASDQKAIRTKAGEMAGLETDDLDGDMEKVFEDIGEMVTVTEGNHVVREIAIGPIDLIFDNHDDTNLDDDTLTIHAPFLGEDGAEFQGRKFTFDETCIVPVSLEEEAGLATTGDLEETWWDEVPCYVQALLATVLFTAMVVSAPIAPLIFVGLMGRCAVLYVGEKAKKAGEAIEMGFEKAKRRARSLLGPKAEGPKAEGSKAEEGLEEEIFHRGVRKYEGSRY